MQQAPAMPYQATRQSQAGTAEKPGVWLCIFSPSGLKHSKQCRSNSYPRDRHGDRRPHTHTAKASAGKPVSKLPAGMGNQSKPILRARINPAGKGSRAQSRGKPGPDPAQCRIIDRMQCSIDTAFDSKGISAVVYNRYYVKWTNNDITINGLTDGQIVGNCPAVQQVRRNKGAPACSVEHGHRHQVRHGMHPVRMASVSGMPYISTAYDAARCSAQRAGSAGPGRNRFTPGGQVKFPIRQIGRPVGGAPHA